MGIVLLKDEHPDKTVVIPAAHGIEQRDPEHYPLPPGTPVDLVRVVCEELRAEGHHAEYLVRHERLADWDATRKYNQRSWGWEDDWRPDPKGPMTLRFVSGGMDISVEIDDRTVRLAPNHFRAGRRGMKFVLLGRF
jgi:hypothetical protein